jgi:hypothetical protein
MGLLDKCLDVVDALNRLEKVKKFYIPLVTDIVKTMLYAPVDQVLLSRKFFLLKNLTEKN